MIHIFPKFAGDAASSPLGHAIASSGIEHRFISSRVSLGYRSRLALILLGWPRVIGVAMRSAIRSLWASKPYPDALLLDSHFEVLVFGALRALRMRRGPRIVLIGFIFTPRRSRWLNALRRRYFTTVLGLADTVIVHSTVEALAYQREFSGARARFVFVPYGLHIFGRQTQQTVSTAPRPRLLAAGRSGRDYATLLAAVSDLEVDLHVVCDRSDALAGLRVPPNVTVLRACYGADYVKELNACTMVVVPLAVDDISAGQMVMLQAMAFGKPMVVTRTRTTEEYVVDGLDAALVPRADSAALRNAITNMLSDPARAAAMGQHASKSYEEKYSMAAFVRNILAVI
jgi:glycosyltransferase involved in cell wall biosynthesis